MRTIQQAKYTTKYSCFSCFVKRKQLNICSKHLNRPLYFLPNSLVFMWYFPWFLCNKAEDVFAIGEKTFCLNIRGEHNIQEK